MTSIQTPFAGHVQVHVNGDPYGDPIYLAPGDSILFAMPGQLTDGRVNIAENRVKDLEAKLAAWGLRVAGLEQAIRDIAAAATLDEAIGIAYRSGALHDYETP